MNSSNTKTVMFGPIKDTQTAEETKPETSTAVAEGQAPDPEKETRPEASEAKPETEKPADTAEKEEAKGNVSPAKESPEETKPALKVDFGDSKKEAKSEETQPKQETVSVNDDVVLDYLNKKGLKVEKLSDLTQKVELNEAVEKFRKFNEETGLGAKEYYSLNRNWKEESPETRISEYLRMKHPNLSDENIQMELELAAVTQEDEDELGERELKAKKLKFAKLDNEALAFLKQKQQEFEPPKTVSAERPAPPTEEDIAKAHRPYWDLRDKSLKSFDGVKFNVEGIGEINAIIDEEDKSLVSKNTETMEALIGRWKDGDSLNTERLVEDNVWGIKPIRQKIIAQIVEQTHALTLENFSKENRNVNLDKAPPSASEKMNNKGLIIQRPKNKKEENFGKPLIPVS